MSEILEHIEIFISYSNTKQDFWFRYFFGVKKLFWSKIIVSFGLTFLVLFFDNLETYPDLKIFTWSFQNFLIVYFLLEWIWFVINFFIIRSEKQELLTKIICFKNEKIFLDTIYDKKDYKWESMSKVFNTKEYYIFVFKNLSEKGIQIILPKSKLSET